MPRFTKDELLIELSAIFLLQADHIWMGAGVGAAENFIGFSLDNGERYSVDYRSVDLTRFDIAAVFEWAYDAAFWPTQEWSDPSLKLDRMFDLALFLENSPRLDPDGTVSRSATPDGCCWQVAEAVVARWKLEHRHPEEGEEESTFSIRELALLADMTEGAVRNALADKTENGLRPMPRLKPVKIEREEALRWLSSRRGFRTPGKPSGEKHQPQALHEIENASALGHFVEQQLETAGHRETAPALLGWTADKVEGWCRGTSVFEVDDALKLSHLLQLDGPRFAAKALEVSLRRDNVPGDIKPDL